MAEVFRYLEVSFGKTKYPTKKNENDPEANDGMVDAAVDGHLPKLESQGSSRDTGVCFVRGKVCGTFARSVPR